MESTKLSKNDPPEVLVLPPNILEKLGINLGSIPSCSNGKESKSGSVSQTEEECVLNVEGSSDLPGNYNNVCDGSSILETANLMKASVFLSPTFTNLKHNNVLNDMELNSFDKAIVSFECNVSTTPTKISNMKINKIFDKTVDEKEKNCSQGLNISNCKGKSPNLSNKINIISEEIIGSEKIKELITTKIPDNCSLVPVPIDAVINKNGTNFINNKVSLLSKEINKKDCNGVYEKPSNNSILNGVDAEENKTSTCNYKLENSLNKAIPFKKLEDDFVPIRPRSEDISTNSNCVLRFTSENQSLLEINENELKLKHSENSDDYSNLSSEDPITVIEVIHEDIYDEIVNNVENVNVFDSDCNCATSTRTDTINILPKNHWEPCIKGDDVIQSDDVEIFKLNSSNNTNVDREQEVAINNDLSNKENLEVCSRNKVINVNQNKVKSKLCIQGVEKPGGDNESEHKGIYVKDLKTYSRAKRTKFLKQSCLENQDCVKSYLNVGVDINCNVNNINSIYEENTQKYCLCNDFGYFSYYERDNDYQHIHYWEQKGAECSLDTILSIYEDNRVLDINITGIDDNVINAVVKGDDEPYNSNILNICWMSVDSNSIDTKDLIDINQEAKFKQISDQPQSENTETKESNEKDSKGRNIETLKEVSAKSSKLNNSIKYKKMNRKRKIDDKDDSIDELKTVKNFCATSSNEVHNIPRKTNADVDESKNNKNPLQNEPSEKHDGFEFRDTYIVNDTRPNEIESNIVDDVEVSVNELNNKANYVDIKVNENDTISTEETNRKHQKIKKRKCSLPFNEVLEEAKKLKPNDGDIKCGVCKCTVESNTWDSHVKDHCFIAWEDGKNFNFNDELLFEKLKQHLNDNGKLICVICDKVIKRVKKFLSHVEGCITYRGPVETTDGIKDEKSGSSSLRSKHVICGVCKTEVTKSLWLEHIAKEHNYMAWKDGETALDVGDEEAIFEHLHRLASDLRRFECNSCGKSRKCAVSFLKHIKKCEKPGEGMDDTVDTSATSKDETSIKCGVCQNNVLSKEWLDHIFRDHQYLAWKTGEPELDLHDSNEVYTHLYNLSKELGGLLCSKCGCRRKYVNSYLKHVDNCDGENPNCTLDSTMNESNVSMNKTLDIDNLADDLKRVIRCGVCSEEVDKKSWESHIRSRHYYKAWEEGRTPLNLDSEEDVYNHLYAMSKKYNGLTCNKCGTTRKYVKVFLQHIESCNLPDSTLPDEVLNQESCKCGVCGEEVPSNVWKSHAMTKHYNVAWLDGQTPIDTNNSTAVEKCLKEYKQVYNKYICNVCGIARVSAIGFFAHVVQCGRTEEEIDRHRGICDICNNKYLLIYKNQHISMHRDQEYAKQRKLEMQIEKKKQQKDAESLPEKRLAAERARTVIEKYKKFKHNCSSCDFGADSEEDVKNHTCSKTKYNFSDSEESIQLSSEHESEDTDVNSELSNEEQERPQKSHSKKKKHADPNPAAAFLPFQVKNTQSYLYESAEDFRKNHLTSNVLYPQWRTCQYEVVPDELLPNYLPTLEESCKLQLHKEEWITLKKFEGNNDQKWASASFTGGGIQCMSWVPPRVSDAEDALGHVVCAAVHRAPDAPRLPAPRAHAAPALLQLWDHRDLRTKPKFALGIALDYGTVWSMDWCPSGTRDTLSDEDPVKFKRLGLLAVACSNGSAYVLSVPYPSTIIDGEKNIFKLKPVAELRLSRGNRHKYQATAINWPAQKGHSTILVGYSDGTIASFNLECDSSLLTDVEDDVKIYYPFQDERTHNSCVTAVTSFPGVGVSGAAGSSSATGGARAAVRGAGRGARSAVTATSACFMPHWPDLLLAGNDAIVYQAPNVLSWWGGGRRLGSQQACAGCARCGRVALVAPPAVRLVSTHPVHHELDKITVALLQMKPLVNKKSKQKNDDLATKLEPISYEDAIKKYGIELKLIENCDKSYLQQSNKPRDHYPERFPLSDVPAMAFNLSPKQHKKLAIATHSGFIFVITV